MRDDLSSSAGSRKTPQVAIIGAGPVGLALAIELGHRGVTCVLAERNDREGYAPRAKTTNVRTRTHLRRWGIADVLAEASPFGVDYPNDVKFVTQLGGHLLTEIPDAFACAPGRYDAYPEHGQWVPQYKLEQVLRAHAETLAGVTLRFETELVTAGQDSDGVDVTLKDVASGASDTLRCRYMVGADGARSAVRELIGARMTGEHGLSRHYNIIFKAPGLAQSHRHGPGNMYWQINARVPSVLGPMDTPDLWFFMPMRVEEKLSDEDAVDLIRRSTGIDLPYEILSRDEWVASRLIANKYSEGRIFLAGDACHLHPPFGGYGMNMGVADGVDLGWKLAARLQGWGGAGLLDSYEAERRPVHEFVMAEAVANHSVLSGELFRPGLEEDGEAADALRREAGEGIRRTKEREFYTLGTVLGVGYQNSPIVVPDGGEPPPVDSRTYTPSTYPGCLAPHAWLKDGRSLYDLFGLGYTLVVGRGADMRAAARLQRDAAAAHVPLRVVELDEEDELPLYDGMLILVRPDQYVGWRGRAWQAGVFNVLTGSSQAAEIREVSLAS